MRTRVLAVAAVVALAGVAAWWGLQPPPAAVVAAPVVTSPPVPAAEARVEPEVVATPTTVVEQPAAPGARQRLDVRAARAAMGERGAASPEALEGPLPVMPAAPPVAEWAEVPVVPPFGAGTPAPAVTRALKAGGPSLAACFSADESARWARLGSVFSRQPGMPGPALGPALLLLELEGDGQVVRVVDAPAEARGSASDGTLNCAQAALRGVVLPVPTQGGARFKVRFPLRP